jgi:hypothetical protein
MGDPHVEDAFNADERVPKMVGFERHIEHPE